MSIFSWTFLRGVIFSLAKVELWRDLHFWGVSTFLWKLKNSSTCMWKKVQTSVYKDPISPKPQEHNQIPEIIVIDPATLLMRNIPQQPVHYYLLKSSLVLLTLPFLLLCAYLVPIRSTIKYLLSPIHVGFGIFSSPQNSIHRQWIGNLARIL